VHINFDLIDRRFHRKLDVLVVHFFLIWWPMKNGIVEKRPDFEFSLPWQFKKPIIFGV
jgi:hypothetical protein